MQRSPPIRSPCKCRPTKHIKRHFPIFFLASIIFDFTSIKVPKAKIELAVADDVAEQVTEAIVNAARTGKIGDGKIFVTDLIEAVRIRTGETGTEAV